MGGAFHGAGKTVIPVLHLSSFQRKLESLFFSADGATRQKRFQLSLE
jgi:hypothetical protein